jgi:dihydroneopterin aldolase
LHRQNAGMTAKIVIERLEFQGACGVTAEERGRLQPIVVDAELDYAPLAFHLSASSGDLSQGLDYAAVGACIHAVGTAGEYVLLETLADRLAEALFKKFPVSHLSLWIRKPATLLPDVKGSVGIRLSRDRHELNGPLAPASFLCEVSHRLSRGRALDVAAGRGRNALHLARLGYAVEALDRDTVALEELGAAAAAQGHATLTTRVIDLEPAGTPPPELGKELYDVITVFFYLYRPLFPILINALKQGGMLVYETFLVENHLRYGHPRRREFCLDSNELLRNVEPLRILHYDEGDRFEAGSSAQTAGVSVTARLLAQKR